jgi:hypothetical protein
VSAEIFVRVVEANRIDVVIDVVIARMHVMTISHRSNVAHADQTRDKKNRLLMATGLLKRCDAIEFSGLRFRSSRRNRPG